MAQLKWEAFCRNRTSKNVLNSARAFGSFKCCYKQVSLSSLLASSLETRKRGIFCILLTQCCNAAMFCNELQCHNSFWSEITVTFLKACELNPCSQSECASMCWNPKYDQVARLYSELHSLQASSLEEGLCTD